MADEAVIETPAVEAEVTEVSVDGPEVSSEEATPSTEIEDATPSWEDRIAEWGGEEAIQDALTIYNGLTDEKGVANLFIQAGRELGLGDREMEAFISGQQAPVEEEYDESLDEVMTRRDFLAELDKRVLEPQRQTAAEQAQAAYAEHLSETIGTALDNLGVPEANRTTVLSIANQFVTDDSDEAIAAAIKKGHETFKAVVKAEAEAYAQAKIAAANGPAPLTSGGAGAPGGEEVEPVSFDKFGDSVMDEAIKRARARLSQG